MKDAIHILTRSIENLQNEAINAHADLESAQDMVKLQEVRLEQIMSAIEELQQATGQGPEEGRRIHRKVSGGSC